MQDLRHAKPGSPEASAASLSCARQRNCSSQSSATSDDTPGWGHAEAYLALGRELQCRGDHLGARNWIEKALIAAPDFKTAQRQLRIVNIGVGVERLGAAARALTWYDSAR